MVFGKIFRRKYVFSPKCMLQFDHVTVSSYGNVLVPIRLLDEKDKLLLGIIGYVA